jgi:large subunit ribosomal protein L5
MATARLQQIYREKVAPELTAKFGYKSPMQVPRLTKITLNMGVSEAVADKKVMDNAVGDLTKIAGQKPVVTKAKKAIAGFKIREGQAIGCMVTLRGVKMYEFLDRFVTVALPRVRDFRGISAGPSTAAATTTSGSRNRSSSPRSSTTRSTPCAA